MVSMLIPTDRFCCAVPRCPALALACLPWLLAAAACSPTFNWREWRSDDVPLHALMPCKPETAVRTVPLLGAATPLHMHSCETGGVTFALAWAEIPAAAQVPAAIAQWRAAALATLRVDPAQAEQAQYQWTIAVRGADMAQGVQAQGQIPEQPAVHMRAAYFAQGTHVYQAAVYASQLPATEVVTFFESLRLP
ncbi:MAG: hypothetical protein RLZZ352_1235 [Pseudomonadota bacterium]|jgi:hypothetical protein